MSIQLTAILDRFPDLLKFVRGDRDTRVERLQTPQTAGPSDMIFASEPRHLKEAIECRSTIWVTKTALEKDIPTTFKGTLILSGNPMLAMAQIGKAFFPLKPGQVPVDGIAVHPTATVAKTARLGRSVKVGPGAVISDGCVIGDEAIIGANSVLDPNVKVGRRTHIHPLVFIGHSCEIGADCEIKPNTTIGGEGFGFAHDSQGQHHRITHYGRVIIEDRVDIGANVQIDRGTFDDSRIGEGTKIDNHSHFGHNIRIGKHSIIVAGALVAGSVTIGSHCVIGGRANIAGHLHIADGVQLMAASSVGKSIEKAGQYGGLPIQDAGDVLKSRAVIPMLPMLRKQVLRILKKLEMEE